MKKKNVIWLVSIAFLLLSSPVYSQIKLGFQLGPNFTNPSVSDHFTRVYEIESKTYLFGGILFEFKINDMFYIQPEVSFLPKGFTLKVKPEYNPYGYDPHIQLIYNYYEVTANVLSKFDIDNLTPFLFAGPSLSFLSEASIKSPFIDREAEKVEKTDFSINFGAGVEFSLSKSIDIFVIARYSLGLTDIEQDDTEVKTRGIALAAGLKFFLLH